MILHIEYLFPVIITLYNLIYCVYGISWRQKEEKAKPTFKSLDVLYATYTQKL